MKELTMDEMADIQGGDSCKNATIVGGALGVVAFGATAAAFLMTGGIAPLVLGGVAYATGLPSAGTFIGSLIAGCYS